MTPPLTPIGDIGVADLTENVPVSNLNWSTASDWDNAADELNVVHEVFGDYADDAIIHIGYPSFDQFNSNLAAFWPLQDSGSPISDVVGSNDSTGESSLTYDETGMFGTTSIDGTNGYADFGSDASITEFSPNVTVCGWILAAGYDSGAGGWNRFYDAEDGTNDRIVFKQESSSTIGVNIEGNDVTSSESPEDGNWHFVGFTSDGNNIEWYYDATNPSSGGGPGNINVGSQLRMFRRGQGGDDWDGNMWGWRVYDAVLTSTQMSQLANIATNSYLTTGTKSFASGVSPDLANLTYSLNTQTIELDIIGSPGTGSEETVTQVLDGSSSYSLTWSNSHTDFRVKVHMETSDKTQSPTFSQVELAP